MFFFFNDTATTEIYTLSLHDALPISRSGHTSSYYIGRQDRFGLRKSPENAVIVTLSGRPQEWGMRHARVRAPLLFPALGDDQSDVVVLFMRAELAHFIDDGRNHGL